MKRSSFLKSLFGLPFVAKVIAEREGDKHMKDFHLSDIKEEVEREFPAPARDPEFPARDLYFTHPPGIGASCAYFMETHRTFASGQHFATSTSYKSHVR
jgi:hypothetical protein